MSFGQEQGPARAEAQERGAGGWHRVRGWFGLWRLIGRADVVIRALCIETRRMGKGFKFF
jgi:hypothetical protein